jgi:hypothetical protein
MLSRINHRYLSRQNSTLRSALIVLILLIAFLCFLVQINWGDTVFQETEHSKQMSAHWVMIARASGCDLNKLDGPATESDCDPKKLKPEDYQWAEKQVPGHLQEALQWALRRDRILHGQQ